jgi:hypothetical protein
MIPPETAPIDHTAWNELMIERPYSRCTRSACEFCATSVMESMAPARNSAIASTSQPGARPASKIPTEATTVAATATRADR